MGGGGRGGGGGRRGGEGKKKEKKGGEKNSIRRENLLQTLDPIFPHFVAQMSGAPTGKGEKKKRKKRRGEEERGKRHRNSPGTKGQSSDCLLLAIVINSNRHFRGEKGATGYAQSSG